METPIIRLSAAAKRAIQDVAIEAGGDLFRITISDRFEYDLRFIAKIGGSRLLDADGHRYLLGLDRSTTIVFQCHHGIRSQSAAEYFLRQGFRNLCNLQGGIDAWSQLVDASVPRY